MSLLKKTIFYESANSGVRIMKYLFVVTFFQHFSSWLFVKIFGDKLWFLGNETVFKSSLLNAAIDGSYPEHYALIFLFWSFLLSTFLTFKFYKKSFIIPIVYLILYFMESLDFLERFTLQIIPNLFNSVGIPFNPKFSNIFEIIIWLIVIILIFLYLSITFKYMNYEERKFIAFNFFFFLLIAFFGIGIDQIISLPFIINNFWHGTVFSSSSSFLLYSLNLIEEWGEIFSIGLGFLWSFNLTCYKTINKT